jgi:hypothetical protein
MQDYNVQDIRTDGILTGSYVPGTVLDFKNVNPQSKNQLNVLVKFVLGSLNHLLLKIEYSDNGTDWYQETFLDIAGALGSASVAEYKFASTGNYMISVPIKAAHVRISAKGDGTATSSSLGLKAVVGLA